MKNVALLAACLFLVGCGHQVAVQDTAYKTLDTVSFTVATAMQAAADAKHLGQIDDAEWQKIADVYEEYQAVMRPAIEVAKADLSQPPSAEVILATAKLIDLIQSLK